MGLRMFCELPFLLESFTAMDALEWSLSSVLPHVFLQSRRSGTGVIAEVTFVRLFFRMLRHRVDFQIISCNAGKIACFASVWLFPRMSLIVLVQLA